MCLLIASKIGRRGNVEAILTVVADQRVPRIVEAVFAEANARTRERFANMKPE